MATTFRVRYKNHATPQEQHTSGDRWYLDSDAGRKFSGTADLGSSDVTATGTLTEGASITTTAVEIADSKDFVYIKNTGSVDLFISLNETGLAGGGSMNGAYLIVLSEGEAFASQISTSADVYAKTSSGTTTVDYYVTT